MDPHALIDTAITPGLPAPFWLIQVFKVAGFTLHMVPMNVWFAGLAVALIVQARGSEHGKRWAQRLMREMPIIVAFGVNLGIVPLLFIQVAYAKLFYPATILMAWFWLFVVLLLIPAYYGVYWYVFLLGDGRREMPRRAKLIGWCTSVAFVIISFFFVNAMSLMTNVGNWGELWKSQDVGGAVLGLGLNLADATLWPRWLMVFGLALTTSAAWIVFDAAWFGRQESDAYHAWALQFAWKLATVGLIWFAVAGSWYVFGTWREDVFRTMFSWPWMVLTALTALSPGLPWAVLAFLRFGNRPLSRAFASLVAAAQLGAILINAVSRQTVQLFEVREFFDVAAQPVDPRWGQFALFMASVVVGLGLVVWMIRQAVKAPPKAHSEQG